MTDSNMNVECELRGTSELSPPRTLRNRANDRPQDASEGPSSELEAARLAHEIVARFVRDPGAFAKAERVSDGRALMRDYRRGLDARLDVLVGAPKKSPDRLATLGTDWTPSPPEGDTTHDAEHGPRMGAVVLLAVASISVAALVVYTTLIRHKPL